MQPVRFVLRALTLGERTLFLIPCCLYTDNGDAAHIRDHTIQAPHTAAHQQQHETFASKIFSSLRFFVRSLHSPFFPLSLPFHLRCMRKTLCAHGATAVRTSTRTHTDARAPASLGHCNDCAMFEKPPPVERGFD